MRFGGTDRYVISEQPSVSTPTNFSTFPFSTLSFSFSPLSLFLLRFSTALSRPSLLIYSTNLDYVSLSLSLLLSQDIAIIFSIIITVSLVLSSHYDSMHFSLNHHHHHIPLFTTLQYPLSVGTPIVRSLCIVMALLYFYYALY